MEPIATHLLIETAAICLPRSLALDRVTVRATAAINYPGLSTVTFCVASLTIREYTNPILRFVQLPRYVALNSTPPGVTLG